MTCPSSGTDPLVEFNDLSLENLVKGNYVACFGGDSYIHAIPVGNPNGLMLGVFGVVNDVQKFPIGMRMGLGKGTRLTAIKDGTSNTLMLSEILTFDVALDASSSTSPSGRNRDWRGCVINPGIGGNTFTAKFPPNAAVADVFPGCDTRIPPTLANGQF